MRSSCGVTGIAGYAIAWLCIGASVVAFFSLPASAQGFMITPLRLDATQSAARTVEVPLRIYNTSVIDAETVALSLADLSQAPDGHWVAIERGVSGSPAGPVPSAFDWITLPAKELTIPAAKTAEINVAVKVPPGAQGTYFAALLAESPQRPDTKGLVVRVRFLIPIIVRTRGVPPRQKVELDGPAMKYQAADKSEGDPTTLAGLTITNRGKTFSRVRGQLLIDRQSGDRWHPVTKVDIPEHGIIPGITLQLGDDLHRRLPSGTYRLHSTMWVDGRLASTVEKQIEFVGDPNVDALAYDTTLTLDPPVVRMASTAGATRTTVVRVENPSEYPVDVRMEATTPRALQGVALGEITGNDFSAASWTEIRPSEFTIRPGGRQNVRVIGALPATGADEPNYYADILLHGTYTDGQSAGETRSTVHLTNGGIQTALGGTVDQLQMAEGDGPSKYIVQARFLNIGNADVEPEARAQVFGTENNNLVLDATLAGDDGPLLPLGVRTLSEAMNFEKVDPGNYLVRVTVEFGQGKTASDALRISVADDGGAKRVTVLPDAAEAAPEVASPPAAATAVAE
jgi:hypothetical protein